MRSRRPVRVRANHVTGCVVIYDGPWELHLTTDQAMDLRAEMIAAHNEIVARRHEEEKER